MRPLLSWHTGATANSACRGTMSDWYRRIIRSGALLSWERGHRLAAGAPNVSQAPAGGQRRKQASTRQARSASTVAVDVQPRHSWLSTGLAHSHVATVQNSRSTLSATNLGLLISPARIPLPTADQLGPEKKALVASGGERGDTGTQAQGESLRSAETSASQVFGGHNDISFCSFCACLRRASARISVDELPLLLARQLQSLRWFSRSFPAFAHRSRLARS